MGALLWYNGSLNTFTWSALRFPAAGPEHDTEYTSPRGGLQGLLDGSSRHSALSLQTVIYMLYSFFWWCDYTIRGNCLNDTMAMEMQSTNSLTQPTSIITNSFNYKKKTKVNCGWERAVSSQVKHGKRCLSFTMVYISLHVENDSLKQQSLVGLVHCEKRHQLHMRVCLWGNSKQVRPLHCRLLIYMLTKFVILLSLFVGKSLGKYQLHKGYVTHIIIKLKY